MTKQSTVDLIGHVQGLVADLAALRAGEIPTSQANARAVLARETTRAMILLAQQSKEVGRALAFLPAPEAGA